MAKKNTGISYEELVQEVYQALLAGGSGKDNMTNMKVQHNVVLQGKSGTSHQIDVYWEFEIAGIKYATIVEVKDWKTPVKQEQLHSFKTVLDDIPGFPHGVYVSRGGFQSGAKAFAEYNGIKLMQITENEKEITLRICNLHKYTHYQAATFFVDEEWASESNFCIDLISGYMKKEYWETWLVNPVGGRVCLQDLFCIDAVPYYWEPDGVIFYVEKQLTGLWYWDPELCDGIKVRITGYSFECYNTSSTYYLDLKLSNVADFIISDVLNNKIEHYDPIKKEIRKYFRGRIELYL